MLNQRFFPTFAVALSVSCLLSACAPNSATLGGPFETVVNNINAQLTNCAPGQSQSGASDAFFTLMQNKCWGKHVGSMMISNNMDSYDSISYFMDITARFYCGAVNQASYVNSLQSFYGANANQDGVVCIVNLAAKENPQAQPSALSAPPQ